MSTTSNSRASAAALLLLALGCASSTPPDAPLAAPDAPQPAIADSGRRPPSRPPQFPRLELATVRVRPIDNELAKLVAPQLRATWHNPVAVEATTTVNLPNLARTSSPALIINDRLYPDTWALAPNRLIAFIPDRAVLRDQNKVETIWIGGGPATRSKESVTFSMPVP